MYDEFISERRIRMKSGFSSTSLGLNTTSCTEIIIGTISGIMGRVYAGLMLLTHVS